VNHNHNNHTHNQLNIVVVWANAR